MKKVLLFLILVSWGTSSLYAQLQQGEFTYVQTAFEGGNGMVQSSDSGYIIAGGNNNWGYLLKLDYNANLIWSKDIGGSKPNGAYSIVSLNNGQYVISGSTSSFGSGLDDMYIFKIDNSGNLKWTRTVGNSSTYEYGYSITHCNDGGFAIAGSTGVGGYDVYVVKLDSIGNLKWTKTIGGSGDDKGYSIIQSKDGGLVIAGCTNSFGAGNYDVYVIKLSSTGNLLWTKTIGGSRDDMGHAIIQDKAGNYIITGYSASYGAGNEDMYIIKLDSLGGLTWTKTVGGANNDQGNAIIQNSRGQYVITGSTNSFGPGIGANVYLVCMDTQSNLLWTKAVGGQYDDFGSSLIQCSDKGYAISGSTNSFGAGGYYVYFLKTDSVGNVCADTGSGGTTSTGGALGSGGTTSALGVAGSGGRDSAVVTTPSTICSVLGINSISGRTTKINLYPVPCDKILYLNLESTTQKDVVLSISDISGRVILTRSYKNDKISCPIDISGLQAGMYFISLDLDGRKEVRKFIKL